MNTSVTSDRTARWLLTDSSDFSPGQVKPLWRSPFSTFRVAWFYYNYSHLQSVMHRKHMACHLCVHVIKII